MKILIRGRWKRLKNCTEADLLADELRELALKHRDQAQDLTYKAERAENASLILRRRYKRTGFESVEVADALRLADELDGWAAEHRHGAGVLLEKAEGAEDSSRILFDAGRRRR